MKLFLVLTVLGLGACPAFAADDGALKRVLSLLSTLRSGDDYAALKKAFPEVGPLHPDAGDDNTEALVEVKIDGIVLNGEFNFSRGRLISHGFSTKDLTHSEAHDFLLRCTDLLEASLGESKRRVELPAESDGPRDKIGISFNWNKDGEGLGLDFSYRKEFAKVSWGAQADSMPPR